MSWFLRDVALVLGHRLKWEFLRFLIVGTSNTAVSWVLFFTLIGWFGVGMVAANVVAWSAGAAWSFYWNRRFTFGDSTRPDAPQLARFLTISLSAVALSTLIVHAMQRHGPLAAQVTATAVLVTWNFTLYRLLVFRSSPGRIAHRRGGS